LEKRKASPSGEWGKQACGGFVWWRRGTRGYWGRGMMGGWKMGHAVVHANRNAALWQPDGSRRSVKTWNWNRMIMRWRSLGKRERFPLDRGFLTVCVCLRERLFVSF